MFLQIYILILTLWFSTLPCFRAKIVQILQKVILFFLERGEKIEPWLWHIWIAQWLKVSPLLLIFFDFSHLQRETCGQSWTKSANFKSVSFSLSLQFFFETMFLFARALPLLRISAILDHVWESKDPKTFQKGPFHEFWIGTQNFGNF